MCYVITETYPKARKAHICEACIELFNSGLSGTDLNLTFAEKRALVKARRDNWKIKKGQRYYRQFNGDGGYVWSWKARIDIFKILEAREDVFFHE